MRRVKGFVGKFSKRLAAAVMQAILVCSVFCLNCEAAGADTFNPDDYADYVLMSESDAVNAYEKYIKTMTPGGDELKIYCKAGINDKLKYKKYSVYFDSYMKFAYQAASEIMAVNSSLDGYTTYYRYYCTVREGHSSMTADEYAQAVNKAKNVAAQNNYGSDYDKIKRVYEWICDNVAYDYSYNDGSIYDALIGKKSVCAGYAGAFQVIMEALGIECYINEGEVNREAHAWNIVKLDGKYYFVDATWGDTGNDYDKYLLFGTNMRTNITGLRVSGSSYSDSQKHEEVTLPYNTQPETEETVETVFKPAETAASGNSSVENVELTESNKETEGKVAEENKGQTAQTHENNQESQAVPQGGETSADNTENMPGESKKNTIDNSDENVSDNQTANQTVNQTVSRTENVEQELKEENKGQGVSKAVVILSVAGVLGMAGTAFLYAQRRH